MEGLGLRETASPVSRRVITSIDDFADGSKVSGMALTPLRPGAIRASHIHADFGAVVADELDCPLPFAFQGKTIADRIWLVVPLDRRGGGQLNGVPLTPGDFLAFDGSVEVTGASGAPLRWRMLSITQETFERAGAVFGVKPHVPSEEEVRVAPVFDGGRLSRAFDFLSQILHHQDNVTLPKPEADALQGVLLEIVTHSLGGESRRTYPLPSGRLTSAQVARGCEDYARNLRYQNVTLTDLCKASGVSERRVRSAFYECFHMSPTAYLRVAALNAVRRQLLHGSHQRDPVSRAATDWGFWHLSRFAAQYRALFAELPSDTLARRLNNPQYAEDFLGPSTVFGGRE